MARTKRLQTQTLCIGCLVLLPFASFPFFTHGLPKQIYRHRSALCRTCYTQTLIVIGSGRPFCLNRECDRELTAEEVVDVMGEMRGRECIREYNRERRRLEEAKDRDTTTETEAEIIEKQQKQLEALKSVLTMCGKLPKKPSRSAANCARCWATRHNSTRYRDPEKEGTAENAMKEGTAENAIVTA